MQPDDLLHARWYYEVSVRGCTPETVSPISGVRHRARLEFFREIVAALYRGTLGGRTVLDLGCNAGLFGIESLRCGASGYTGVDASEKAIAQARMLFEDRGILRERYRLIAGDIFDFLRGASGQTYQVVLALGLVHHLPWDRFFDFFRLIADVCSDTIVLDLVMANTSAGPAFCLHRRASPHPANPDGTVVMHPTRGALSLLLKGYGFRPVVLRSPFPVTGAFTDYHRANRRFVVGCRATDIGPLLPFGELAEDVRLQNIPFRMLFSACRRKLVARLMGLVSRRFAFRLRI